MSAEYQLALRRLQGAEYADEPKGSHPTTSRGWGRWDVHSTANARRQDEQRRAAERRARAERARRRREQQQLQRATGPEQALLRQLHTARNQKVAAENRGDYPRAEELQQEIVRITDELARIRRGEAELAALPA